MDLCLFYALEQPKVLKNAAKCVIISHDRPIFAHIQVGELDGSGEWGESRLPMRIYISKIITMNNENLNELFSI